MGVDCAIECAGHPAALDLCLTAVKRTGSIAQVGLFVAKAEVDMFKLCEKGIRLNGCWGNAITLGPRLVEIIGSGGFPVETIITGHVQLDNAINEGFDVLTTPGNSHVKLLIDIPQ